MTVQTPKRSKRPAVTLPRPQSPAQLYEGFHWRLVYSDESYRDEPLTGGTLSEQSLNSRKSARFLEVTRPTQLRPIVMLGSFFKVDLADEPGGGKWWPIFYRVRIGDVDPGTGRKVGEWGALDAVILGRAREADDSIDATLWLVRPDGEVVDAPEDRRLIDFTMIKLQMGLVVPE